jgi:hypothetical protein
MLNIIATSYCTKYNQCQFSPIVIPIQVQRYGQNLNETKCVLKCSQLADHLFSEVTLNKHSYTTDRCTTLQPKALYLSTSGVITDPGSTTGGIATGRDWESHRAAHNWPSVVRVCPG